MLSLICFSLHVHDSVENVLKHVLFLYAWRQGYSEGDWSSNKEAPRKYFALPSYESNQNQETFAYQIGNQT